MTRRYCTYFDSQYLARGITMLRSLRQHDPAAAITVLALDPPCDDALHAAFGSSIDILPQSTLLATDPALAQTRPHRTPWAFYSTQKSVLVLSILRAAPAGSAVIYIDADTCFFSSPAPLWEEAAHAPIALSPHRFCEGNQHLEKYGIYNAGFLYFRATPQALQCVEDWRTDCLNWCDEQPQPDGRFMNQGYLNQWPARYPGTHIFRHPGQNLAPWNVNGHHLEIAGPNTHIDGQPLIFYHFSQVQSDADNNWYALANDFEKQFSLVVSAIYEPYARAVATENAQYMRAGSVRTVNIGEHAVRIYSHGRGGN